MLRIGFSKCKHQCASPSSERWKSQWKLILQWSVAGGVAGWLGQCVLNVCSFTGRARQKIWWLRKETKVWKNMTTCYGDSYKVLWKLWEVNSLKTSVASCKLFAHWMCMQGSDSWDGGEGLQGEDWIWVALTTKILLAQPARWLVNMAVMLKNPTIWCKNTQRFSDVWLRVSWKFRSLSHYSINR